MKENFKKKILQRNISRQIRSKEEDIQGRVIKKRKRLTAKTFDDNLFNAEAALQRIWSRKLHLK